MLIGSLLALWLSRSLFDAVTLYVFIGMTAALTVGIYLEARVDYRRGERWRNRR